MARYTDFLLGERGEHGERVALGGSVPLEALSKRLVSSSDGSEALSKRSFSSSDGSASLSKRSLSTPSPLASLSKRSLSPSDDLREDLRRCVDAVGAAGFDVVVVDQTMPEQRASGLHTASVLVPGLLPIDFGWQRQRALTMSRLRTAPRAAGLRDHDLRADELNPAPHPFP
jgi:hypothetical protein